MTDELKSPDPEPVKKENALIVEQATKLTVANVEEHAVGLEMYQALARRERIVVELFRDAKQKADQAHKAITKMERTLLEPLGSAKAIVAAKCQQFKKQQEAAAAARAAALAEQARQNEEARLLAEAIEADEAGDRETANAILDEKPAAPMVHVEAKIATLPGVGTQKRWKCVIDDAVALVQYIAANPSKIELLETEKLIESHPALNKLAVALKAGFSIPGCRAVEDEGLTNRG